MFFLARVAGFVVDNLLLRRGKEEKGTSFGIGYWVTTIVAEIILGIFATIIVFRSHLPLEEWIAALRAGRG